MSVRVFAAATDDVEEGAVLTLDADESRYVGRVRRLRDGAAVDVLTEEARWAGELVELGPPARIRVLRCICGPDSGPRRIVILASVDRAALELAVREATALGAHAILVTDFERSQRRGREHDQPRLRRIVDAARRQCGRPDRPHLDASASLAEALDSARCAGLPVVVADLVRGDDGATRDSTTTASTPSFTAGADGPLTLVVGPEGGLTDAERDLLNVRGASPMFLGPWVLRTETAVTAALARLRVIV